MGCCGTWAPRQAERRGGHQLSPIEREFLRHRGGRHPGARVAHGAASAGHKVFMAPAMLDWKMTKLIGFRWKAF